MTDMTLNQSKGIKAWLMADFPANAFQARCQRAYIGWLSFKTNPIAMLGLFIVGFLCLVALFARRSSPMAMAPLRNLPTDCNRPAASIGSVQTNWDAMYLTVSSGVHALPFTSSSSSRSSLCLLA